MRFAVEVVQRARAALGDNFMLIFRISAMDMLEGGLAWEEVASLAKARGGDGAARHQHPLLLAREPGADHRDDGAARRLRAGDRQACVMRSRFRCHHQQPHQHAAMWPRTCSRAATPTWSRWRGPCWPIPELVKKALEGREDEINTCIACNQACLDHTFTGQLTSCLVNPRACHETELTIEPAKPRAKRIAVVGAGPAGLADATVAGRARPQGDAVRCGRRDRRPVQPGQARSPARRSSTRPCATSAA
jgi:2,4-dienoyl-CoA reductase (NADPH2)